MGQIPDDPAVREMATRMMGFLHDACQRLAIDSEREKMLEQMFLYGAPVNFDTAALQPLPDVSQMRIALETAQTWFNTQPSTSPHLNADLMMAMQTAGYPIEVTL